MEEYEKIYEELKECKEFVGSIEKNFFFDFVDYLIGERDELEKKIKEKEKNKNLEKEIACKTIGEVLSDKEIAEELTQNIMIKIQPYIKHNYISKDKIREALGIEEDVSEEKLLSLLETLMSEVDRLEDIEDKKVEVDYERVFAKGVKSVKDKIREKLEVINNEKLNYSEDEWYLENEIKGYAIDKIKEILEEE